MSFSDERDHEDEAATRADVEREGLEELAAENLWLGFKPVGTTSGLPGTTAVTAADCPMRHAHQSHGTCRGITLDEAYPAGTDH
jgi:hypothetical protein